MSQPLKIRRLRRPVTSVDMTPMIDCVFQLLIFFMLSSTFLTPALSLDLPEAHAAPSSNAPPPLIVAIDAKGRLFVNQDETTFADLAGRLRPHLSQARDKVVLVRGDQAMPFQNFVKLYSAALEAGATRVDIAHDPAP